MKHKTFLFIPVISLLVTITGCKKFVEVKDPDFVVVRSRVFNSDEAAMAARAGMYASMAQGVSITNGQGTKLTALYADELWPTTKATVIDLPFYNHAILPSSMVIDNLWSRSYTTLYLANAILEGLSGATAVSDSLRREMMGEARCVRAMSYSCLINLFGDVPLVLATDYHTTSWLPRSPVPVVYQQILADLQAAIPLLPLVRLRPDTTTPGNVRITRWAAKAMLARVLLYQGDWAAAKAIAGEIIEAGPFSLNANLATTFLIHSPETIFQLQPVVEGVNSAEGALFLPNTGMPPYVATKTFLDSLEPGDGRKSAWMGAYTEGSDTLLYPYKYKVKSGTPVKEYSVVLRLAELYLIRAEASARLDLLQGPDGALSDLNKVRARAQLAPLPTGWNGQQVMAAIEQERRVEFFAEWSHRFIDLKRWPGVQNPATSRWQEVMKGYKPTQGSFLELWPIPASQLKLNGGLIQNPGYS
ncbi:RagB/SusD family nutrient uptake outer membrane protein [Pseudoflavitalea sp. X16]|uniref:RagB/SusD family nutrient uptake outer membrane protein n=1 Tax=Paraflavitalea devenefica TaxID=2716334 RepID=UPI001423F0E1|nr:RagB/SusD family nutrient uptake outer membrane protein [Paraflavitalea devenefica]NII27779.1 RagB/SusD family nutrient uptake outer membrane protein [Paraflavitalea devenefica]